MAIAANHLVEETADHKILGRCMLGSGEEFACEAWKITLTHVAILTPYLPKSGEIAVCYFENIGMIRGRASRIWSDGFILALDIKESDRRRIANAVKWHENRALEIAEQRSAPRIEPLQREVKIRFAEAVAMKGLILNISTSGAAVEMKKSQCPFVGSVIRLGDRKAVVVRHLENGFAVQFDEPLPPATFDETVIL